MLRIIIIISILLYSLPVWGTSYKGCLIRSPKRSHAAIKIFRDAQPCPVKRNKKYYCPGFHIHHIIPLCCGGADDSKNMQWLKITAHKKIHANGIVCKIKQ